MIEISRKPKPPVLDENVSLLELLQSRRTSDSVEPLTLKAAKTLELEPEDDNSQYEEIINEVLDALKKNLAASGYVEALLPPTQDIDRNRLLCLSALAKWNSCFVINGLYYAADGERTITYSPVTGQPTPYTVPEIPSELASNYDLHLHPGVKRLIDPSLMVVDSFVEINLLALFAQDRIKEEFEELMAGRSNDINPEGRQHIEKTILDRLYHSVYLPVALGILEKYRFPMTERANTKEEKSKDTRAGAEVQGTRIARLFALIKRFFSLQ